MTQQNQLQNQPRLKHQQDLDVVVEQEPKLTGADIATRLSELRWEMDGLKQSVNNYKEIMEDRQECYDLIEREYQDLQAKAPELSDLLEKEY